MKAIMSAKGGKVKITSKMYKQDKMYGTTSMGARGQVVIPAEARKDLNLKPGDKLIVMGKFGKALGLVKAESLQEIVSMIMEHIGDSQLKGRLRNHIEKLTKDFIK